MSGMMSDPCTITHAMLAVGAQVIPEMPLQPRPSAETAGPKSSHDAGWHSVRQYGIVRRAAGNFASTTG
jgi:hypothetical protein